LFSSAQADGDGMIAVTSNVSIASRAELLGMMRGRNLPVEVHLLPSASGCDAVGGNNRREYLVPLLHPPVPTDLQLAIESDTVGVRRVGRGSRGRSEYHLHFWVKARNLTPNEAGGPGATVRNVRCSYKLLERDGDRFDTLYESAFTFPEVRYGSDWRMELGIPFEMYPDSGHRLSFILVLDPDESAADPDRSNNRASGGFLMPE
jgi:hypothetical protein